mmetsp:Transcript_29472/g.46217  ORF Transcript_29472/g.46217 Transcript_29472/m.46217 type:complete len:179 (-) Transcript_29472:324-860(-)
MEVSSLPALTPTTTFPDPDVISTSRIERLKLARKAIAQCLNDAVETEKCHHEGEGNVIPEEGWDVIQKKASVYWDLYVPRITEENGIMHRQFGEFKKANRAEVRKASTPGLRALKSSLETLSPNLVYIRHIMPCSLRTPNIASKAPFLTVTFVNTPDVSTNPQPQAPTLAPEFPAGCT